MSTNAASELDIANLALQRLGIGAIASLTGTDKQAKAANRIFADTRDEVQRMFPWACLITRQALSCSTFASGDLTYVHTLGVNALSVLEVITTTGTDLENIPFRREGRYLYTDQLSGYVRYTNQVTNITPWDPLLTAAIETRMASKMALWLTGKAELGQLMQQEFMQIITVAIQTKAIEEKFEDNKMLLSMIDKSFLPFLATTKEIAE